MWRLPSGRVVDWVMGGLIGTILGAYPSWWISEYFASEGWASEIEKSKKIATEEGRKEGMLQAQRAFSGTEQDQLQALFPEIFRQFGESKKMEGLLEGQRKAQQFCQTDYYSRGKADGIENGEELGYELGLARCQELAEDVTFRLSQYIESWGYYEALVRRLADVASQSSENPDDEFLRDQLVYFSTATANASKNLREAMASQSSSFNSLATDLLGATEARNYSEMRRIGQALHETMAIKRNEFIESKRKELTQFEQIIPR